MKKVLFLMLLFLSGAAVSVKAQVRIGGDTNPHAAAVLDLNVDNTVNPAVKGGLALPRVNLVSTTALLNGATPIEGMTVYHTGTGLNGAGVYIWSNSQWSKLNPVAPVITTQPAAFSFSRLKDANADPNGQATVTAITLSVVATGSGLSYQWYEVNKNINNPAKTVAPGTSNTSGYTPVVTAWGMRSYYCVVSNAFGSVTSDVADVAIGCGAKTVDGQWLRFMCYNLGANTGLDPFTYSSTNDSTSNDIKGWLFQWGRFSDGHQWRASASVAGPYSDASNAQVPSSATNYYGKFITNGALATAYDWHTPQYDYGWGAFKDASRDPCPAGWRVPTQTEWGSIFRGGTSPDAPGNARANTWTGTTGNLIRPNGTTTTLFLPAAGYRIYSNAVLDNVGSTGHYWSSTSSSSGAFSLYFNSSRVYPGYINSRARGFSVRCVAE